MKHEILIYNNTSQKISKKFIVQTVLKALQFLKLKQPAELAVLIVNGDEIKRLNKIWRKKNYTPDELSFGLNSRLPDNEEKFAKKQNKMLELGEIVINVNKIFNKNHFATILIHGLSHLLGYHHEKSATEAQKINQLEKRILKNLKV